MHLELVGKLHVLSLFALREPCLDGLQGQTMI